MCVREREREGGMAPSGGGRGKKQKRWLIYDDVRVSLGWILVSPCSPLYQNDGYGPAGGADGGEFAMDGRPAGDISLIQVGRGAYTYTGLGLGVRVRGLGIEKLFRPP